MNSINSAIPSSLLTELKDQHYKTKGADKAGSDQSDSVKKVKPERFIKPSKCLIEDHEKNISTYRVDFEKKNELPRSKLRGINMGGVIFSTSANAEEAQQAAGN